MCIKWYSSAERGVWQHIQLQHWTEFVFHWKGFGVLRKKWSPFMHFKFDSAVGSKSATIIKINTYFTWNKTLYCYYWRSQLQLMEHMALFYYLIPFWRIEYPQSSVWIPTSRLHTYISSIRCYFISKVTYADHSSLFHSLHVLHWAPKPLLTCLRILRRLVFF